MAKDFIIVKHTEFGKTKYVRAEPWNMTTDEKPDLHLWVERGEDMYALESKEYKGKKVAIIHAEDWRRVKTHIKEL